MKNLQQWLDEYSESHKSSVNKTLHWVCVPVIVFSVYGLLRAIPWGNSLVNAATFSTVVVLAYYGLLSWRLALGMALVFAVMYAGIQVSYTGLGRGHVPAMIVLFVLAWIGQFLGHNIEGRRPSFYKDLQFLLIGPLWLLADLYRRLGIAIR